MAVQQIERNEVKSKELDSLLVELHRALSFLGKGKFVRTNDISLEGVMYDMVSLDHMKDGTAYFRFSSFSPVNSKPVQQPVYTDYTLKDMLMAFPSSYVKSLVESVKQTALKESASYLYYDLFNKVSNIVAKNSASINKVGESRMNVRFPESEPLMLHEFKCSNAIDKSYYYPYAIHCGMATEAEYDEDYGAYIPVPGKNQITVYCAVKKETEFLDSTVRRSEYSLRSVSLDSKPFQLNDGDFKILSSLLDHLSMEYKREYDDKLIKDSLDVFFNTIKDYSPYRVKNSDPMKEKEFDLYFDSCFVNNYDIIYDKRELFSGQKTFSLEVNHFPEDIKICYTLHLKDKDKGLLELSDAKLLLFADRKSGVVDLTQAMTPEQKADFLLFVQSPKSGVISLRTDIAPFWLRDADEKDSAIFEHSRKHFLRKNQKTAQHQKEIK